MKMLRDFFGRSTNLTEEKRISSLEMRLKSHLQICEIDWVYVGETQPQWNDEQKRPPLLLVGVGRGLLRVIDHNGVVQGDVDGEVVAQVVGGQLPKDLHRRKTTCWML